MNITDYLRSALLNHTLGITPYTPPTTIWAGLFMTPPPTSAGGGTEVTAADYARVPTTWSAASVGIIENATDVRFPASGVTMSDWGTILAAGLFDASANGHLLFYGPLSAGVLQTLGTDFLIPAQDLTITLS